MSDTRRLTVDLARRLRVQGLSIPASDDIEYESDELRSIVQERQRLTARLDELDRQLFGDTYEDYLKIP